MKDKPERPNSCEFCGVKRMKRPDYHWQYDCNDSTECMKKWDVKIAKILSDKYL